MRDAPEVLGEGLRPEARSKHAWLLLDRADPDKRSVRERVADFLEVYGSFDEVTAREQASRCVQCPEPTCVAGCPLGNRIPEWMALTAEGQFLEAAALSQSTSTLPEVCARLCAQNHLCEGSCILSGRAEPVSIGALEQFINEYAFAHEAVSASVATATGFRVAVLGCGLAGIACADELAKRGHAVTVMDSELLPGGLLVNGIPAFRLEKTVVQRRLEVLRKRGVEFRLGVRLGEEVTLAGLQSDFDAVFLGFNARKARALDVPGAGLNGVIQALPFLAQKNMSVPMDIPPIEVAGQRVVVVGGGDVAMDCLRTAIRGGAREVLGVYRRDEASQPCNRRAYQDAVEEGARFLFQAAPVAVLDAGGEKVGGIRLVRTELGPADNKGRRPFSLRPGTEFNIEAEVVLLALGFEGVPFSQWHDFGQLATNEWGGISVDNNYATSVPGVFAGGDLVWGPCLVSHAVRDARRAALQIDSHLGNRRAAAIGVPHAAVTVKP